MAKVVKIKGKSTVKPNQSLRTKKVFKKIENIAPHLKTREARRAHVKEVVAAPLTKEQKRTEAKAIEKTVKKEFKWSEAADRAAFLLAEDRMSDKNIAITVGVNDHVLAKWRTHPQFKERVSQYLEQWKERVRASGVSVRENRLRTLDKIKRSLENIIEKRATKYANRKTPGVSEGIMIRRVKAVGHGAKAKVVRQWELDSDLIDRILSVDQQAAKELGQWKDIMENHNQVLIREYEGVSPDDV